MSPAFKHCYLVPYGSLGGGGEGDHLGLPQHPYHHQPNAHQVNVQLIKVGYVYEEHTIEILRI